MRTAVLALLIAGCGRVGFDARTDRVDATVDSASTAEVLVWLPFDDDPIDGADNRGTTSTIASCLTNCPTLGTGIHAGAFVFGGIATLRLPRPTALELSEATVMAWIRLDVLPLAGESFVVAGTAFGTARKNTWEMFVYSTTNGTGPFVSTGGDANDGPVGNGPYVARTWSAPIGTWVHLAMTWKAGAMQRIVIDGTTQLTDVTFTVAYDMHDILVGGDEEMGAIQNQWRGAIDDFVIIDRELSDAEIQSLAAGPS